MIHCTATPEGRDYQKQQVMSWFHNRGWRNPGYREITHLNGSIDVLQNYDRDGFIDSNEITNGARGWNSDTIHKSYIGGVEIKKGRLVPKDTRTNDQFESLFIQVKSELLYNPEIKILGHNQVSSKACPCFDVPEWLKYCGIPKKNIVRGKMLFPVEFFGDGLFDFELTLQEMGL